MKKFLAIIVLSLLWCKAGFAESLADEITKLEKASLDKIDYMEKKVINDLKFKIAEESVKISEDFLKKQIDNNSQQESINESLKEIQNSLKSKQDFI